VNAPPAVAGRLTALVVCAVVVALVHGVLLHQVGRAGLAGGDDLRRSDLAVVGSMSLADPLPAAPVPAAPARPATAAGDAVQAVAVPSEPAASSPARRKPPRPPPLADKPQSATAAAAPIAAAASAPDAVDPPASVPQAEAKPTSLDPTPSVPVADAATAATAAVSPTTPPSTSPVPVGGSGGPGAVPFEWPPSTRLSYVLTGNFRGEVHGSAQVEWVLDGPRYQVHLDVVVGLRVAPLMQRRMTSAGEITAEGLRPLRYEELTKLALRDPRRLAMRFEDDQVQLADGRRAAVPPGVQDTASQFIQLAYRFALDPALLSPGGQVPLDLALPRRVDPWIYDVVGTETLSTGFGSVEAVHLKPRPIAKPGDTLTAEAWFAPRLRYLPVRIRIQQSEDTHIDLMVDRLPDLLRNPAGR
jgi:Protein of unknown function (DUF3108)